MVGGGGGERGRGGEEGGWGGGEGGRGGGGGGGGERREEREGRGREEEREEERGGERGGERGRCEQRKEHGWIGYYMVGRRRVWYFGPQPMQNGCCFRSSALVAMSQSQAQLVTEQA